MRCSILKLYFISSFAASRVQKLHISLSLKDLLPVKHTSDAKLLGLLGLYAAVIYIYCATMVRKDDVIRLRTKCLIVDFGVYVNNKGLVQGQAIDWSTGTIEKVFPSHPYFLLASHDTIEARIIHSGRLVDRFTGEDIRITCEASLTQAMNGTPTVQIRTSDVGGSRQFELPSNESHSIYEWAIFAAE